jgi:subtilisin family serine protease
MKQLLLRLWIALTMAIMLINIAAPGTPANAQGPADYLPDEVVVKLFEAADLADIEADYNLELLDQFGSRAIYRMAISDETAPPLRAAALAADPRVVFAEPNFIGRAPEGVARISWPHGEESEDYVEQWAAGIIRLPEAHTITRGAGTTVAVLDTGVDAAHPALALCRWGYRPQRGGRV